MAKQHSYTIGKSGERGSGISVLVARQDDEMMIINKSAHTKKSGNLFNDPRNSNIRSTLSWLLLVFPRISIYFCCSL